MGGKAEEHAYRPRRHSFVLVNVARNVEERRQDEEGY